MNPCHPLLRQDKKNFLHSKRFLHDPSYQTSPKSVTLLNSITMDSFICCWTFYKWKHTVCSLFCLASFTHHNDFFLKGCKFHLFLKIISTFNYYLFIYLFFWLCWVFVSVRGLPPVAASGGHSSSWCAGLSPSRPLLLRSTGSRRAGSVVVAHGPSRSAACGILPDQIGRASCRERV